MGHQNNTSINKNTFITASPFLLEYRRLFPHLYFDGITGIVTFKSQPLKHNDKHPQLTEDNLSSQDSPLC